MDDLDPDDVRIYGDDLAEVGSPRARWHASAVAGLQAAIQEHMDAGDELPDDFDDRLAEGIGKVIHRSAEDLVETLREGASDMLADHVNVWTSVRDEVRDVWGEALDQLYAIVVCADEASRYFVNEQVIDAHREGDHRFGALAGLLAQSCRVALEVWHLLTSGFAAAAASRARTLHELNVVVTILAKHGHEEQLASRFVAHAAVDEHRYFKSLANDEHPEDQETLVVLAAEVETLCAEFGQEFRNANGWAAKLIGKERPNFLDLEEFAELDDWRPVYIETSHAVHPSALSSFWNTEEGGSVTSWRLSGLADPAISAMGSLCHIVATVFNVPDEVNTMDLVTSVTLSMMRDEAQQAFHDAADQAWEKLARERVHPAPSEWMVRDAES